MTTDTLQRARRQLHEELASKLWSVRRGIASNSDKDNHASVHIGRELADAVGVTLERPRLRGSAAGTEFERMTLAFLVSTFPALHHMRPGEWQIEAGSTISNFEQYAHLAALHDAARGNPELAAVLRSDYTIRPDILITRKPEPDERINKAVSFVGAGAAQLTPIRLANNRRRLLHASISCKWTIRSDRTQNSRAEALNLLRNRKGRSPHIAVVTAEPLPSRLVSIAIGTGDIDCTYHVALHELQDVVSQSEWHDARDTLAVMIEGKRLRDISDLPLDLVI